MKKYFVSGGAGFIGSHTVDHLVAAGECVTVYDSKTWQEANNLHHLDGSITYVQGDVREYEALRTAMHGHTHVLHLAARVSVPESMDNPVDTHSVNVTGTLNVFEAARRCGVSRVVYASSAAVYGAQDTLPVAEMAPLVPDSPYGLHKKINEDYAELYSRVFGVSSMGLRYFNVYGLRQDPSSPYSGVISIFAKRFREGGEVVLHGHGVATRDFVHVSDVANANLRALESTYQGVANVGTQTEVSIKELFDLFATLAHSSLQPVVAPPREGDIPRSVASIQRLKEVLNYAPKNELALRLPELLLVQ